MTRQNKRNRILKDFNNFGGVYLLFSIKCLNEGVDIPSCDSILITYPSKSKISTIQRINRATRLQKENPFKVANIFLWADQYDEILDVLSSLKECGLLFKDKIKVNINNFYGKQTEEMKLLIENYRKLISDYVIGVKQYIQYTPLEKAIILLEYVEENKCCPSSKEIYKNQKIGSFWNSIKHSCNKELYINKLSKNNILKENYDEFNKKKEEKKEIKLYTPLEKAIILLEYVEEKNCCPSSTEIYKYVKIGSFWVSVKHSGHNKELYTDMLSKNNILKENYNELNKIKEMKKDTKQYTPYEKAIILLEYVDENKCVPSEKTIYKDVKIGQFWKGMKKRKKDGSHKDLYMDRLSKNNILKENYDEFNKKKEEKKDIKQYTPYEKAIILLEYVKEKKVFR
jgi:ribosomal protein L22